uniref:Integrase catalytic domain-containing protein n=1 Tax=Chromera velia CCMP2878 TaxID=1169474 RepID=A0A0G4I3X3_9ALVE|eukprot:Cvel_10791.t1-p1 / transcript=Cvel_10791.t1 / gene=Cvel_10791 / organism=Chromera_velia_CCMP2878 / gene_product=Retrovirus-related Pol polyprotein from transposon, putative / transcript_product=Retrovirus-related Pol polyprotein from transposon, putative / location=Cvel_scaffold659:71441-72937(-) / protein_length=429 / sequence_SO=supercontig / SO=protein_coding / is_pseudo=false
MHHNHPIAGHAATKKLTARLLTEFWWPGLRKDVRSWVYKCHPCQERRAQAPQRNPQTVPVPTRPFQKVGIDVKGPLPTSRRGNRFVLVITCALTRWPETFALPEVPTWVVAKILFEEIICRYGFIEELVSDRGTNFLSEIVRELLTLMKVRHHTTTGYHPQANGIPERFNRSWAEGVGKQLDQKKGDWDLYLQPYNAAYRTASYAETGLSPFELLFAHTPQPPNPIGKQPAFEARAEGTYVVVGTPRNRPHVTVIRPLGGKKRDVVSSDRLQLWEPKDEEKEESEKSEESETEEDSVLPREERYQEEKRVAAETRRLSEREGVIIPPGTPRSDFRLAEDPELEDLLDELGLGDELEVPAQAVEGRKRGARRKGPLPVRISASGIRDCKETYRVSFDDGTFAWLSEEEIDLPEMVQEFERKREKVLMGLS